MAKAKFTKGQEVYLIESWDNKGTFSYRKLIVGACGKVRMHLLRMDGTTLAERIYVQDLGDMIGCFSPQDVFHAVDGFDPVVKALEMAAAYIEVRKAEFASRIARDASQTVYFQKLIAELHEPRALDRDAA